MVSGTWTSIARCSARRCRHLVVVTVAGTTAAARAGAPAATAGSTGIATRGNALLLGRIARPAGGQLGRLDFLGPSSTRGRGAARGTGRLVQRALGGILRLFGLLGHQHLARLVHHGADGLGLGQGLAAAGFLLLGALGFVLGVCLCGLGGRRLRCLGRRGSFRRSFGSRRLGRCFGGGLGLLRFGRPGGFPGLLLGFALAPLLGGLFFLALQQFGLAACALPRGGRVQPRR